MRHLIAVVSSVVIVSAASVIFAQTPEPQPVPPPQTSTQPPTPPPPPPPAQPEPQPQPQPAPQDVPPPPPPPPTSVTPTPTPTPDQQPTPPRPPSTLSGTASGAYDRRDALPNVNLYLPEGQATIRLRKLIKNVLFESQIDYKFVNGDISTYLRYKYYSRNYTYKIGVFDTIEFSDLGSGDTQEFQRVRGGLFLGELPRDYNRRYFWLLQNDSLTFGDVTKVDNKKSNVYTKVGIQLGTEFDERMNAIVGESRGHIVPVLTAFRDLGPQKFSLAAAVTQSASVLGGDYKYTKLESEALRRWDITDTSFAVTRAHVGAFVAKSKTCGTVTDCALVPEIEHFSIPNYEMFLLGGREALKSVRTKDESAGTNEFHVTGEYFVPMFRNKDFRTWVMHWNTLYGIGYLGAGAVGYDYTTLGKTKNYVLDGGIGAEAAIFIRDYEVLFSVIYAHTLHAPDAIKGSKLRFSIRTIR